MLHNAAKTTQAQLPAHAFQIIRPELFKEQENEELRPIRRNQPPGQPAEEAGSELPAANFH
jgi:hypothetical protein